MVLVNKEVKEIALTPKRQGTYPPTIEPTTIPNMISFLDGITYPYCTMSTPVATSKFSLGGCLLRACRFQHVGPQLAAHLLDARLLHVQLGLGACQLGSHLALGLGHHGHGLDLRIGHSPGHVRAQGAELRVQARDLGGLMVLHRLNGRVRDAAASEVYRSFQKVEETVSRSTSPVPIATEER